MPSSEFLLPWLEGDALEERWAGTPSHRDTSEGICLGQRTLGGAVPTFLQMVRDEHGLKSLLSEFGSAQSFSSKGSLGWKDLKGKLA